MSKFNKTIAMVLVMSVMVPSLAFAQTTSTSSIQALLDQMKALQAQIIGLQQQQKTLVQQQQTNIQNLVQTLRQGDRGENVRILQQLLAQDPTIFPEGTVSGFFGPLTEKAVKRFQQKHGIEQAGNVGPKTLKKLNELFFGKSGKSHDDNKGKGNEDDDDEENDHGSGSIVICHFSRGDSSSKTISVGGKAYAAHLKHGDVLGTCTGGGNPSTPDTIAPIISNAVISAITSTSASVSWNTNEQATSKVYYSTTTPVNLATALTVNNGSRVMNRTLSLTGLIPSTTYFYVLESKDYANNTATTSTASFTTAAAPDTTAPVISGTSVSAIATTTATVSWTTNEAATGKVYYSTTSPVNLGTALTMSNGSLTTGHTFVLTSLAGATTYYYVLESKDAANNTATTSTASFVTTN